LKDYSASSVQKGNKILPINLMLAVHRGSDYHFSIKIKADHNKTCFFFLPRWCHFQNSLSKWRWQFSTDKWNNCRYKKTGFVFKNL